MTVVQVSSTMSQEKRSQNLERENGQPSEPVPKRKKADFTRFECLLLKFPPLGEEIFGNLNDQMKLYRILFIKISSIGSDKSKVSLVQAMFLEMIGKKY